MQLSLDNILYIAGGLGVTLQYTLISVAIGISLAALLAIASLSNQSWLQIFSKIYISIFRGTPILIQLSIVYYALPSFTGYNISPFAAGVIAFSFNSAAYISEIIRAGINSIDHGQSEAAKSLNIPYWMMMRDIILPQAVRNILPALVNELTAMLKETAIMSVIGEADLMRRAQIVASANSTYFEPLLVAAAGYYIVVMIFSLLAKYLERRLAQ